MTGINESTRYTRISASRRAVRAQASRKSQAGASQEEALLVLLWLTGSWARGLSTVDATCRGLSQAVYLPRCACEHPRQEELGMVGARVVRGWVLWGGHRVGARVDHRVGVRGDSGHACALRIWCSNWEA